MSFKKRNFAYGHPTFGRTKNEKAAEPHKGSVYYFWWEFLRRSEEYKKCCLSGGKGCLGKLYADFGDVFSMEFNKWWHDGDRGARLFAEQLTSEFKVVTSINREQTPPDVLYLQVPLSLPKRELTRKFQEVLNQKHTGRAGQRNNAISTATYPVIGHVDLNALDNCLRVYDLKINNNSMKHWEIAQECIAGNGRMSIRNDGTESKEEISDKKLVLANISCRYIKNAKKLIQNVINGQFPGGK